MFEADEDMVAMVTRDLDKLAARGIDITGVRTSVVCTKRLNDARLEGKSRFDVDLHAMERIVLYARERENMDVDAVCGKVGGYARYSDAFGPLAGRLHAIIEEGAKKSSYSFPGLGIISFVRDADAHHLLVAMASMVGKWIREVMMGRIVRFYGHSDDEELSASGYHDPVTNRFVDATSLVRKKRAVPDTCFERVGPLHRLTHHGAMSSKDPSDRIVTGPLASTLFWFGAPLALGMGLQTTFNLVDAYLISRLDADVAGPSLGAIGICDQIAAIGSIVSYGISTATAALVAQADGRGDREAARRVAWQSMIMVSLWSIIFGVLGLGAAGFIMHDLVGAKGQVAELGTRYLRVILGGSFSIFFLLQVTTIQRALGSSKTPVAMLLFSNVLNLVLAVLLVYGPGEAPPVFAWGPPIARALHLPRMQVIGAAWATIIARTVTLLPAALLGHQAISVSSAAACAGGLDKSIAGSHLPHRLAVEHAARDPHLGDARGARAGGSNVHHADRSDRHHRARYRLPPRNDGAVRRTRMGQRRADVRRAEPGRRQRAARHHERLGGRFLQLVRDDDPDARVPERGPFGGTLLRRRSRRGQHRARLPLDHRPELPRARSRHRARQRDDRSRRNTNHDAHRSRRGDGLPATAGDRRGHARRSHAIAAVDRGRGHQFLERRGLYPQLPARHVPAKRGQPGRLKAASSRRARPDREARWACRSWYTRWASTGDTVS